MIQSYGKYQVHSGVLLVEAHDSSFYQATWAVYEAAEGADDGADAQATGRLVDGGTLEPHYAAAAEAMQVAQAHAAEVGQRLQAG